MNTYRLGLLDDVVPFWMRHGVDREFGGLLTGLDHDGSVIDTDKAIWLQGRAAWTRSPLHQTVEPRTAGTRHCFGVAAIFLGKTWFAAAHASQRAVRRRRSSGRAVARSRSSVRSVARS